MKYILLFLAFLSAICCNSSATSATKKSDNRNSGIAPGTTGIRVGHLENNVPVKDASDGQLASLVREVLSNHALVVQYFKGRGPEFYPVTNFGFEYSGNFYYLTATIQLGDQRHAVALHLTLDQNNLDYVPGGSDYNHTCTEHCCQACAFVKNSTGEIVGCQCNLRCMDSSNTTTSSYCGHSVSTK